MMTMNIINSNRFFNSHIICDQHYLKVTLILFLSSSTLFTSVLYSIYSTLLLLLLFLMPTMSQTCSLNTQYAVQTRQTRSLLHGAYVLMLADAFGQY